MSLTLETYEQDGIHIECRWDKYFPNYEVSVTRILPNGVCRTDWYKRYDYKDSAHRSFKRQVAKAKRGEAW